MPWRNVKGSCFTYSARELHAMHIMFAKPLQEALTGVNLNIQKGGEIIHWTLNSEQGLFTFMLYGATSAVPWRMKKLHLFNSQIVRNILKIMHYKQNSVPIIGVLCLNSFDYFIFSHLVSFLEAEMDCPLVLKNSSILYNWNIHITIGGDL